MCAINNVGTPIPHLCLNPVTTTFMPSFTGNRLYLGSKIETIALQTSLVTTHVVDFKTLKRFPIVWKSEAVDKHQTVRPLQRNTLFPVTWPTRNLAGGGGGCHFKSYPRIKSERVWSFPVTTPLQVILSMYFKTISWKATNDEARRWLTTKTVRYNNCCGCLIVPHGLVIWEMWPILIRGVVELLCTTRPTDSLWGHCQVTRNKVP